MSWKDGDALGTIPYKVYVFPTASEMYDYIEWTQINANTTTMMADTLAHHVGTTIPMHFLRSPLPAFPNSHWMFMLLKKPLDHPVYGKVMAWGFWYYVSVP